MTGTRAIKLTGLAAGLLLLAATGLPAQSAAPTYADLPAALAAAGAQGKLVFVDVYAPWCGYCRRLQNEVYPRAEVKSAVARFVYVRINGENDRKLMRRYSVSGYPTLLFLNTRGEVVDRINGYLNAQQLVARLSAIANRQQPGERPAPAIQGEPTNVQNQFDRAVARHLAGELPAARELFESVYRAGSATPDQKRTALYNIAVISTNLGEYETAVRKWNLFLASYPERNADFTVARYYRGFALVSLGMSAAAAEDLRFARTRLSDPAKRNHADSLLAELR